MVSYFEWVQDLQNFFWNEEEVSNKLREILVKAFQEVLAMSQKQSVNMRLAALMIGIDRVVRAMLVARALRIAGRYFTTREQRRIEAAPINC